MTRRVRTIGDVEAEASRRLFEAHGHRLAEYHAQERAEREAALAGPAVHNGHARHAVEREARARLRRELEAELAQPLIRPGILSPAERQAIRVAEALRRRPARGKGD